MGFIVSNRGLVMDPEKVKAITEWGPYKNLHDARAFLGFANFYHQFIARYLKITRPLTAML